METLTFRVEGLTCADCAQRVEAAVCRLDGVSECRADHSTGLLTVSVDPAAHASETIAAAVTSAGYSLAGSQPSPAADRSDRRLRALRGFWRYVLSRRNTRLTAIAAGLTVLGLLLAAAAPAVAALQLGATVLYATAIVVGGLPLARFAWQELWQSRRLGINALMVIAVAGAMIIGEWSEAAIVVVLFSLGEALEGYSTEQSRRALAGLVELAPPVALRKRAQGDTEEVPVEQLAIGDLVLVRPGDRVSVDGVVVSGQSGVDQAPITGESVPVDKGPGDQVFAGTINTTAALEVEVTRLAADNTLNRMVAMVQEAQSRQSPVQRFIDRFARVYTPAVTGMAVLVAALPPLLLGQPFWGESGWLMRALQLLVIACPCALVISTPVSLVSAMTNAASRGVLVKGGRTLEALSRVSVFAFDKTGTLTEGRPVTTDVIDVCSCGECPQDCGLLHAAAVEARSSHPLAKALLAEAQARGISLPAAEGVTVLGGRGMEGIVNGAQVTVASHAHFDAHHPHEATVCRRADELAAQGKTVIMVRHDGDVCALFGVADEPRAESRQALADLKAMGLRTVMLTGDQARVAEGIGRQIGLDETRAGLLPEDKVSAIAELAAGAGVAMVGDGVNDAPALARATVGIAMGAAGSAQAMETADVVLMGDDLSQLPFLVWLSRRTGAVIRSNIAIALAVKGIVFGLALAGLASLWMAIVADVGASLVVILNGLRLQRSTTR